MIIPLAISVGLLGGLCTWLFIVTGAFLIWAAFVAWACFFQSGGDLPAFRTTIISTLFGVFVAWGAGLAMASLQGPPLVGATIVAASIALYILAAHFKPLSSIPAVTYGYACTFAYLTQNADAFKLGVLLSLGMRNVLLLVPLSLIIGACFAFTSAVFATWISKTVAARQIAPGL